MKRSLLTVLLIGLLWPAAAFGQKPSASPITTAPPRGASMGKTTTRSFVPAKLSYQGLLTSTGGAPVEDGRYGLKFEIFNLPSGGLLRHTETLDSVSVGRGAFSVILHPADTIFSESLYVAVTALYGPGIISPLTFLPRSELTSAPYALNAKIIPPMTLSGTSEGSIMSVTNLGNGSAVVGATSSAWGMTAGVAGFAEPRWGSNFYDPVAVYGNSVNGHGVGGISQYKWGVIGVSDTSNGVRGVGFGNGAGVCGINTTSGVGVFGQNELNTNYGGSFTGLGGVYGNGIAYGGYFTSDTGKAVYGYAKKSSGVYGRTDTSSCYGGLFYNSLGGAGVGGFNGSGGNAYTHPSGSWYQAGGEFSGVNGVIGASSQDGGIGVLALSSLNGSNAFYAYKSAGSGTAFQVTNNGGGTAAAIYNYGLGTHTLYAYKSSGGDYAGYFYGNVYVAGNLGASGTKSFRIDNPLNPTGEYLYHYAIESPQVQNMYDGTITLDAGGEAVVTLPSYFSAVNTGEYSYHLTPIGAPMPSLYVSGEVSGNTFKVSGGVAGKKVSWSLYARRNDPWVRDHPARDVERKPASEAGTYIYPQGYGQPASMGTDSKIQQANLPVQNR